MKELTERKTPANSAYTKVAVQWLNQALFFVSTFVEKIAAFAKRQTVMCNCWGR
jgi:hypothetical protein